MKSAKTTRIEGLLVVGAILSAVGGMAQDSASITEGETRATMSLKQDGDLRTYELRSNAVLRDNQPPDKQVSFSESPEHATVRTGNVMFDGLYAMAVHEATQNSVSQIKDWAYGNNEPIHLEAFQTGEVWTYVWTRDLSYSVYLGLGQFDPQRAINSLLFKSSEVKSAIAGGYRNQIIQDTGSGGSYPVSSDRVVWALGADATLKFLPADEREKFLRQAYPILHDTIEQDRRLVFDTQDGLYRGEQSFLDWREQTYPGWTKDNVLTIAMSKALSVNAADYFLLKTAAGYAGLLGKSGDELRFKVWAAALRDSMNRHFYDSAAGLYSTYLLSDGVNEIRASRYDLLGESLAILCGVADQAQAESILKNYPVGPHGPSVVWPQELTVPIYHNQAIWPFVTAFWIKAARQANDFAAVNAGIRSLEHFAAFNLSNMENYDFVTGLAEVKGQSRNGPVVCSRRQLWSVAGYLSMVQDIIFGLETTWDGIRFRPFIPAQFRNETLDDRDQIELNNFAYRGTRNEVRVHFPPKDRITEGVYLVRRVELNGQNVGKNFISRARLRDSNQWDIYLAAPGPTKNPPSLRMVDVNNVRALFGPVQPVWNESEQSGITVQNGRLVLHYQQADAANVSFNIYRDGALCASSVRDTNWEDAASGDYGDKVHYYAVAAVDPVSGNVSHLTPPRCHLSEGQQMVISAADLKNQGGELVANDHFENWGRPGDTLQSGAFEVNSGGRYAIRVKFSNGNGPVNTGIGCGVKKLEVCRVGSTDVVASGYLVMPQSGDWKRWDMSSPVLVNLLPGVSYSISISEDEVSRNMSYLQKNERYTSWPGGGPTGCNFVNIAAINLECVAKGSIPPAMETGGVSGD